MYALKVPEKDCKARFFGKRNGNGTMLAPLLSAWHRVQVCRDDVSRDRLLLSYSFAATFLRYSKNVGTRFLEKGATNIRLSND